MRCVNNILQLRVFAFVTLFIGIGLLSIKQSLFKHAPLYVFSYFCVKHLVFEKEEEIEQGRD